MGSTQEIVQIENGELININLVKDAASIIQMVQLSNGSLKNISSLNKNDEIISFDKEHLKFDKIRNIQIKYHNKYIYLVLKNGFRILLPHNFELLTTHDAEIFSKSIHKFKENDFVVLPQNYKTKNTKIRFDPWLFSDHLYVVGIKEWYLKELNSIMVKRNLLLKDIADELKVPYWLIRRNASSKDSINLGYLKKFIGKYLPKYKIYEMLMHSRGFKNEPSASKFAKFPFEYNEQLSYLDATIVGDGHIVKNEKQAIIESTDEKYGKVLPCLFYKLHNYYSKTSRINLPGSLAYFYANILKIPKGNKSKIVNFPPNALLSDNQVLISALKGIIDTEGNVIVDDNYVHLNITTNSFKLLLGITSALLRIGIFPSIGKSNKDSTWTVTLSIFKLKKLFKKIKNLKHPKKNEMFIKLKDRKCIDTRIIPDIGELVKNSRKKMGLSSLTLAKRIGLSNTSTIERSGNFSRMTALKLNKVFRDKNLRNILLKDLHFSKVIYKKELNIDTRFIFPKTDNFFFLNHIPVRCLS